jgi:hypothetical protein
MHLKLRQRLAVVRTIAYWPPSAGSSRQNGD